MTDIVRESVIITYYLCKVALHAYVTGAWSRLFLFEMGDNFAVVGDDRDDAARLFRCTVRGQVFGLMRGTQKTNVCVTCARVVTVAHEVSSE